MNKLVVVTKNPNTYFLERLTGEVGNDALVFFNPWTDAFFPKAEKYLVRTTGVYGSDLDLLMLQSLDSRQIVNSLNSLRRFRSKSLQYSWFDDHDFPTAPWINLKGASLLTIEKFFRLFPFAVVKPDIGQGGWGVDLFNWERFKGWWKKMQGKDESYILQAFIGEATELRYFFIKDEFSLVLERKTKNGITANFKKSGEAFVSTLANEYRDIIERMIQASEAQYGAIDLLIKDGQLFILELNSVPGIEQLEKVSGENIIRLLLNAKFFCQIF
jgi:glutathione synthase/RimK-type ligase-like ATP-grasp enzyme